MKSLIPAAAVALVTLAVPTVRAAGVVTILDCDFDSKTVDAAIGLGGAVVGEPVGADAVEATVRDTPLPTPCLQLEDIATIPTGVVRFQFLEDVEVAERSIVFDFDLRFATLDFYGIDIREAGTSTQKFLDLSFGPTGTVALSDETTYPPITIGSYQSDHTYHVRLRFDWDLFGGNGEYDIRVDGVPVVLDRPFTSSEGIGSILFEHISDGDMAGKFWIDNLVVVTDADVLPVEPTSWAEVKSMYR